MNKQIRSTLVIVCLILTAIFITACGPPETLTDTISETEFQQEEFLCQDNGLQVDFQPGKLVCSGTLEGEQVVVEIVGKVVGDEAHLEIARFSSDGQDLAFEEFADLNAGFIAETTLTPEEGYAISSIVITDDDLTITQSLK